jgi:hypothetical protein
MELLEARVALTPWLALLMTWLDDADTSGTRAGARHHAINHNSFVVAQAETQSRRRQRVQAGLNRRIGNQFEKEFQMVTVKRQDGEGRACVSPPPAIGGRRRNCQAIIGFSLV